MSSNLKYKQAVNVKRRTWDLEEYEKRAQERAKTTSGNKRKATDTTAASENVRDDGNCREEFIPADFGAAGPQLSKRAFLKARTNKVASLDAKIGSVEIVNPEAMAISKSVVSDGAMVDKDSAVTKSGVGWHCKVCDCFLKDSLAYLDHINGRKHQRNLGYSMRVERSTKDQVVSRLETMIKAKERCKEVGIRNQLRDYEEEDFMGIVKVKDEELKRRKEQRKHERKERKKKKKLMKNSVSECEGNEDNKKKNEKDHLIRQDDSEETNDDGLDPNIAAMMGFSGFGGGNKN